MKKDKEGKNDKMKKTGKKIQRKNEKMIKNRKYRLEKDQPPVSKSHPTRRVLRTVSCG